VRKKYIGGNPRKFCEKSSSQVMRVDDKYMGYVSLVNIEKVKKKVIVESEGIKTCLFDNGYRAIVFLPDNENWCVEAIYNTEGNIVEWYFDITKLNGVDENGKPFCDDLYLDIALMPDGKVMVFDEDELQEALDNNSITQKEYEMAKETAEMIKKDILTDKEFMIDFFAEYYSIF